MPIFINGVEAHVVVRDLLTTEAEQAAIRAAGGAAAAAAGGGVSSTLKRDAVVVDAVVSTIGFPLVSAGHPACLFPDS